MPWLKASPVSERVRFVMDYEDNFYSMTELCERYGISRTTGYKWVNRHLEVGIDCLGDRSRAPHSCPHKTPQEVMDLICEARRAHTTWGPRKLLPWLARRHPGLTWPAPSTVSALFAREGLVPPRRRRRRHLHPGSVPPEAHGPNDLWTIDFKGHFKTGDGRYCYPLTLADQYSRFLLACQGFRSTKTRGVHKTLDLAFREYGLPTAIRSDNGAPFASTGIHGLTKLNVWWMRLGINHQRITPASPQENGVHERMHRTLKAETCRPPRSTLRSQQSAFDRFRNEFNTDRPHEALDDATPASRYAPSKRTYDGRLPPQHYPGHYIVKRVAAGGNFRLGSDLVFISTALVNHHIGLEEVEDGIWNIYLNDFLLAKIDERDCIVRP